MLLRETRYLCSRSALFLILQRVLYYSMCKMTRCSSDQFFVTFMTFLEYMTKLAAGRQLSRETLTYFY